MKTLYQPQRLRVMPFVDAWPNWNHLRKVASVPHHEETNSERRSETAGETEQDSTPNESEIPEWIDAFFDGDYKKAIALLEQKIEATEEEENERFLNLWLGHAKAKVNFHSGIKHLENEIDKNLEDSYGYITLSIVYEESRIYDSSFAVLEKGLQFAREKQPLSLRKAHLLTELDDTEAAKDILKKLKDDDPEYQPAYSKLGQILIDEGFKEEAKEVYESGLKTLPNNADLLSEYESLLMDLDANEAALATYTTLTDIYPDNTQYLTLLGNVYLNLNLNGLALEAYEKANKIAEEKEGWILANIGNLYNNRGFYPQAIAYLKRASEMVPDYSYAHERLAQAIEMNKKERQKASKKIQEHKRAARADSDT